MLFGWRFAYDGKRQTRSVVFVEVDEVLKRLS
jgi:hypothetical protein